MNQVQAQGKMGRFSAQIKQTWCTLSNDEVKKPKSSKDELIARIREKHGHSRKAIAEKPNALMEDGMT